MELFKKLTKAYKDDYTINIEITYKEKNRFNYDSFVKISDVEIEDNYIDVTLGNGGEMFIYESDIISYYEHRGRVDNDKFVIDMGNVIAIIDTEDISS